MLILMNYKQVTKPLIYKGFMKDSPNRHAFFPTSKPFPFAWIALELPGLSPDQVIQKMTGERKSGGWLGGVSAPSSP